MATRRMLDEDVIGQEKFLEMPGECQALYMHLNSACDDDGFVKPLGIVRKTIAKIDSLKILFAKGYMLPFPDKWAVLRDWKTNNTITATKRHRKERRPELRLLRCIEGRYYLKAKSDLTFTAWLNDEYEKEDNLPPNYLLIGAQEMNERINCVGENQNFKKEEEKNAEDSENTKKIREQTRTMVASWKAQEPQG